MTRNCLNVMRKIAAATKPAFTLPAPTQQELQQAQDQVHQRRLRSRLPLIKSKYDTPAGVGTRARSDYMKAIDARDQRDPYGVEKATGYAAYPIKFSSDSRKYDVPLTNFDIYRRRGWEAEDMANTMFGNHTPQAEDAYQYFLNAGQHNYNVFKGGNMDKRGEVYGGGHAPRYSGKNIRIPKAITALHEYGKRVH